MSQVLSLGSVNVDSVHTITRAERESLEDRYEWFPDRGETVEVDSVPSGFGDDPDEVRHGGKGANQAVATAHAAAAATLLGRVGPDHDEFGVLSALEGDDVDTSRIGIASVPTGTAFVFVGPAGDNSIVLRPGANSTVDESYIDEQYETILAADCLLLQNEIPVEPVAALLADLADEPDRPTVFLDPAPAAGAERLLGHGVVDYLTPNETEYETLRPSLDAFDGTLVRKRGEGDVIVEGEQAFTVTPPAVEVADTTGAGDVLNGFLAARIADGASVRAAVETAVVAGSLSTRAVGARGAVPTLSAVRSFQASTDT